MLPLFPVALKLKSSFIYPATFAATFRCLLGIPVGVTIDFFDIFLSLSKDSFIDLLFILGGKIYDMSFWDESKILR